ncbi:WYL domain-containing protein [Parablastomonas sp. CN1-191]|uniref:WYL domain-containing protein n=1 Tax=Parablastomonas sp. CN1-191 TaxID=3400908 RepID=UPI003BF85DE3
MDDQVRLRWSVRRRLRLIELRLYWGGKINRSDLVAFFGISVPQASQDLTLYQSLAEGNLVYDKKERSYVAGPNFEPMFSDPSADGYLAQLRSLAMGALEPGESWIGSPPAFAGTPRIRRTYDRETLRRLLHAIRQKLLIRSRYASFSEDAPATRELAPHAFGFDGQRWHIRAFCHRSMGFRDFVIGRLSHVTLAGQSRIEPDWDVEWSRPVTMVLKPNPRLPERMRKAIERDHRMSSGALDVRTTICSSYYLESQLDLDIDPALLPPRRLQLVLANRQDLQRERQRAREEAAALITLKMPIPSTYAASGEPVR